MKRKNFLNEIESLTADELKSKATGIAEELMKLRFRQASGQFEQSHRFRELRQNLARVQTLMSKKRTEKTATAA